MPLGPIGSVHSAEVHLGAGSGPDVALCKLGPVPDVLVVNPGVVPSTVRGKKAKRNDGGEAAGEAERG